MTPSASKINAGTVALCAAAFVLSAALVAPALLDGSDLYWHIAAGRWMMDNQAVLRIDPFSSTFMGHPWQTQDWLAEVAIALAYIGGGWSGVLALTAATTSLAAGLMGWFLARRGAVLTVFLPLSFAVAAGAVTVTPLVLSLPVAVLWIRGLVKARARQRAPGYSLLILMMLWANLNAGFLAGLALLAVLGAEALLDQRADRITKRAWAIFAGGAIVAAVITPYGVQGFIHAVRHIVLPGSGAVQTLLPLLLALPTAAVLVQHRAAPFRAATVMILFAGALFAPDWRLLFALATPLLLADPFAAAFHQHGLPSRFSMRSGAVFAVLCVAALVVRLLVPVERSDGPARPGEAFDKIPATLIRSPVLNDPAFGGFLIFRNAQPFIDDRAIYSPSFRQRYDRMVRPDVALLQKTLAKYKIRWTVFAPQDPVVHAMDSLSGWHRLYADRWAVVHVRNDAL